MIPIPHKALAAAVLALAAGGALADINVGVTLSATGPAASLGIPEKNTIALLPTTIAGQKINWIVLDDGSDTTKAVSNTRKLITEDKADVIVGSTTTPNSLAMIDVVSEAQVPMISMAASAKIVDPVDAKRRWVFKTPQSDAQMASIVLDHMKRKNVRSVGLIGFSDAYGEGWIKVMTGLLEGAGIKVLASERYQRTDTSVLGQILKIVSQNPDAVFIAASGTPAALPQTTLVERGFKGLVYQTHGVANNDFLRVGGKALEGTFVPAGPVLVAEQLPDHHPAKAAGLDFVKRYEAIPGAGARSTFAAYLWDGQLILNKAIAVAADIAKPGTEEFRVALRDAIENVKDLTITQGVMTMTPTDHSGLDQRARVIVEVVDGKWKLEQ